MTIEIKPLSVNEAWQGRRFKTPKYKTFEKEMLLKMPKIDLTGFTKIGLEITFGFSNSLSDIDNPLKPTLDCIQKKYGINDRNIYELQVSKEIVKKGNDFIKIKINQL